MPRVPDAYLECSAYCYPSHDAALRGEQSGGSGFVVAVPLGGTTGLAPDFSAFFVHKTLETELDIWPTLPHIYGVTNWHVAEGNPFLRLTLRDGSAHIIDGGARWLKHPVRDVAVLPIPWLSESPLDGSINVIPCSNILSDNGIKVLDVGIGDDTLCIGRLINHDGRQLNRPVARFGNIAMMPSEIYIRDVGRQPCYLIESRTIQGYSGSPLFLRVPSWELNASTGLRAGLGRLIHQDGFAQGSPSLTWLLGVVVGFTFGKGGEGNTGMMAVLPASQLLELLESESLVNQRQVEAAERREWVGGDIASQSPDAS